VIGPDATGVGWVYEYALVDDSGKHEPCGSALDPGLEPALRAGVGERGGRGGVAGRFVKEYQVDLDPVALAAHGIPLSDVESKHQARATAMWAAKSSRPRRWSITCAGRGYIKSIKDIEDIVLKVENGTPVTVKNVGKVHLGSDLRRGVAELDGKGETVGGIVVMRYGENALRVIDG
jgi:Cu(I)/Ag(I) efflux system membrane protein CusA/SilA